MKIHITQGVGEGKTKVSAYDAGLRDAGIHNYNLLYLSSVIPDNTELVKAKPEPKDNEHGWKLYAVVSEKHAAVPEEEAWAGIGWVFYKETKRGLFVHGEGSSELEVVASIKDTLEDMMFQRGGEYGEIDYEVIGITCKDKPVCAIVSAVYESENWNGNK